MRDENTIVHLLAICVLMFSFVTFPREHEFFSDAIVPQVL